ncbi:MAG: P-loop NTPase [Haloarculaceae archaeon]
MTETADRTTEESLRDRVEAALRAVRDPDADMTVFDAGLVDDIAVDDARATVTLDVAALDEHAAREVLSTVLQAVDDVPGVEHAAVDRAEPDHADRTTDAGAFDRVIAVASAKGGVGKSTVATHLACALAADGEDVALFDADVHGPNVPGLLDVSGPVYADDEGAPVPVTVGGLEVMSVGLLTEGGPLGWRGAMVHDAVSDLLGDTAWANTGTLVVDLPPGTSDVVLTTMDELALDGAVVVTTPFSSAVADTERSVELFHENDVPVLGAVVNMAGFVCEECGHDHDLFDGDDPVEQLGVPELASIPFTDELQGTPAPATVPDAMADLASAVDERYEAIWTVDVPDGAVDLRGVSADDRHDAVAEGFESTASGDPFVIVSDRNPAPVREFLVDLAGSDDFERFEVVQQNPDTWLLRTARP